MRKLLILLALFSPMVAVGRIGETYDQCVARYGKPVDKDEKLEATYFFKGGVNVIVTFDSSNRAAHVSYLIGRDFTDKEIQVLLKANANETWEPRPWVNPKRLKYYAPRAALTAFIDGDWLEISTADFMRQDNATTERATQQTRERLRDF